MKTETRTKIIEQKYHVYIAKDGKEFNSKDKCRHHEMILDGTRKVCPECHGEGKIEVEEEYDNYHTGVTEHTTIYPTCPICHGKGYLEKKLKEVWE